jgi:hypothetical protein
MARTKTPPAVNSGTVPVKTTKSVMLTMRVSEATMAWLEDAAKRRELPVSALARMFMLERLSEEPAPPGEDWV